MAAAPDPAPPPGARARIAELPTRVILSLVSAGVMASLTVATASVWLAQVWGRSRRR